jgi:hypothetical protein
MRPRLPIPEKELVAIHQSVLEAVRRSSIASSAERRRENRLRTKKGYTKEHFDADAVLERLAFAPRPPLNNSDVTATLCAAAKRNDARFFIRLGKTLARKPKPKAQPTGIRSYRLFLPPMQTQFLIGRWADDDDDYPALCRLTSDGLLAVLQHEFGREKVSVGAAGIDKVRQRLGLIPLRRPKVHVILVGNRLKYLD